MRDNIKRILKEELTKKEKLDFYLEYYKNLTPSDYKVKKKDGNIIIEGFYDSKKDDGDKGLKD